MTAKEIIDLRDHLKANRAPMLTHWDELSELYMPFRTIDATGKPDLFSAEETYDTTARRAWLSRGPDYGVDWREFGFE